MNGAQELKKIQSVPSHGESLENTKEYDSNQGMGRLSLSKSLPLNGENDFQAFIVDSQISPDSKKLTYIKTKGNCASTELSVTLAWYDMPGSPGCVNCLIEDLDLVIKQVNNNARPLSGTMKFPNGSTKKDEKNNVERIHFNSSGSKRYLIEVRSLVSNQNITNFGMVVTGCFKNTKRPRTNRRRK
jgi:hypothetical protein